MEAVPLREEEAAGEAITIMEITRFCKIDINSVLPQENFQPNPQVVMFVPLLWMTKPGTPQGEEAVSPPPAALTPHI
jgi:hypothetical protein